jgi:leader peptidase (prepilin peptidase)/N-methyltransferase
MLERQWAAECADLRPGKEPEQAEPFDLMRPASRCRAVRPRDPLVREHPGAQLRGAARQVLAVQAPDRPRYPVVELVTGALFALCAWRFGAHAAGRAWAAFAAAADLPVPDRLDTTILPDDLNYRCCGWACSAPPWAGRPAAVAVRRVGRRARLPVFWGVCTRLQAG